MDKFLRPPSSNQGTRGSGTNKEKEKHESRLDKQKQYDLGKRKWRFVDL